MKLFSSVTLLCSFVIGNAWAGLEGNFNTSFGLGAGSSAGDVGGSTFIGRNAGFSTTGADNTFVGRGVGFANTTGAENTFVGAFSGGNNSTGIENAFFGKGSGNANTTGNENTFIGMAAGNLNTTGIQNTFLGKAAGLSNSTGNGNVFLGFAAGRNELGSNKLYISNTNTATPLIYGEFDTFNVKLNGNLEVIGPDNGLVRLSNTSADNTTKAARMVLKHYNNASLPVYLFGAASTPSQNFLAFGGGNAIGNAATQLDFFTAPTTTTAVGTSRMTINGAGNIGMGVPAPAHPLHMASGALVTAGGVWTNASSRDYKENVQSLSPADAALTLASLTPVTYNYKVDKTQAHVGFIAEDVPDLVATKDRKGLSPMDIVAVLTKVTQEQQRLIAELRTELKELKQEVRLNGARANLN